MRSREGGAGEGSSREGIREGLSLLRRNRDFRRLYVAQLISYGGDWFLIVALFPLILSLTGSPVMVALAFTAQEIPFFLFSPIAGHLADRLNRKHLMVTADLARAGLCLGFLLIGSRSTLWIAFPLLSVISCFSTVFDPASTAAVPNLIGEEDLGVANALVGSAWGTMLAVGSALGGAVAAAFGPDTAFVVDLVSFLVSALLLAGIARPLSRSREQEHPTVIEATRQTVQYSRKDHRVLALLAVKGGFGLAAGVLVLLSVFAREVFHQGAVGFGILMGARGVGALVGPFIGRRLAGRDDRRLYDAIGIALVTFGLFYAAFAFSTTIAIAAVLVMCAHLGGGAQWSLSTYGLQRVVPDYIRGRVFAFDFALVTLSITLSSLGAGWAANRIGARPAALVLAGIAIVWAGAWWTATRRLRHTSPV